MSVSKVKIHTETSTYACSFFLGVDKMYNLDGMLCSLYL